MKYTIFVTDAEGNRFDPLGCEQEGIASAKLAARTMIEEDGYETASVYPAGWRFPSHFYTKDAHGAILVSTTDLARGLR